MFIHLQVLMKEDKWLCSFCHQQNAVDIGVQDLRVRSCNLGKQSQAYAILTAYRINPLAMHSFFSSKHHEDYVPLATLTPYSFAAQTMRWTIVQLFKNSQTADIGLLHCNQTVILQTFHQRC